MASCILAAGLALLLAAPACSPTSVPTAPKTQGANIHRGPLTDYVPAAGLRWMLVGSPRALAKRPELLGAFERLVPRSRLDAFATGSGVDLRTLSEGCIAGFDYGTLYLARVGKGASLVRQQFEARLVSDAVTKSAATGLWRVTGLIGNTPESLLTVDDDFIAISVGDPLLVRVAESFALGRFKKTRPALSGAALSSLPASIATAMLRFYAPGPFSGAWAQGIQGVLARSYAVGAAVSLGAATSLRIRVVISGAFGPDLEESRARILKTWDLLLKSPVGHVLEVEPAIIPGTFNLEVENDKATFDVDLNADTIIKGLSAAVQTDAKTLFDW